jgi:hypothetical protein
MLLVAFKVDDIDKAKAFSKDASLKAAMQQDDVKGTPIFSFVTITYQDTAVISSDIQSRATYAAKDYHAWGKAIEEGKKEMLDNGFTVRAYGHDVDDNHNVVVEIALRDTTKAYAYWKSDLLKKRRAVGGAVGVPERFVYRVVQRY